MTSEDAFERLGLTAAELSGGSLSVRSPIDGAEIARIRETPAADMPAIMERAHSAFLAWREVPAPRRGELVRLLAEELRARRRRSVRSSRSKPARSSRRASAKCRR